ncbi:putative heat shock protein 30-like [Scophthalmus maximus]|uniref:Putative heat shock protein 30-like n=1 Tax=Scophthalmus maximus TaxID=52904 RepID=A0A2U9CEL7_SCOMX|nr:putative heat shock protein 30-like [Scophthalmus maximus]
MDSFMMLHPVEICGIDWKVPHDSGAPPVKRIKAGTVPLLRQKANTQRITQQEDATLKQSLKMLCSHGFQSALGPVVDFYWPVRSLWPEVKPLLCQQHLLQRNLQELHGRLELMDKPSRLHPVEICGIDWKVPHDSGAPPVKRIKAGTVPLLRQKANTQRITQQEDATLKQSLKMLCSHGFQSALGPVVDFYWPVRSLWPEVKPLLCQQHLLQRNLQELHGRLELMDKPSRVCVHTHQKTAARRQTTEPEHMD